MIRNPMWIILIYILLLGGTINCAEAPPSTPDALEELLGFTFEHMRDEDTTELVLSVEKLYLWFQDSDQLESAREGFTIDNLNSSAVTSLDEKERNTEGLQGVSVVTKSPNCPQAIAGLITWEDFGDLLDNFDSYTRTFNEPSECFWRRDCDQLNAHSVTKSKWAGVVGIETKYQIEFRWIYTQFGWAFLHRFWLLEPAIGDRFDVKMNANYYIGITIADGAREAAGLSPAFLQASNGVLVGAGDAVDVIRETLITPGALRIHGNWFQVDTGSIPLSDEKIATVLVQNQRNDSERHDVMIADHMTPGLCVDSMMDEESSLEESSLEESSLEESP